MKIREGDKKFLQSQCISFLGILMGPEQFRVFADAMNWERPGRWHLLVHGRGDYISCSARAVPFRERIVMSGDNPSSSTHWIYRTLVSSRPAAPDMIHRHDNEPVLGDS